MLRTLAVTLVLAASLTGSAAAAPRPFTVRVDDTAIHLPATVAAGTLAVHIQTGGKQLHHLVFEQLKAGVTFASFETAMKNPAANDLKYATYVGGNGQVPPGQSIDVYFTVKPGPIEVIDIVRGQLLSHAHLTVTAATGATSPPASQGTVIANTKDRFVLPPGFGKPGVFAFRNTDTDPHDMVIVSLAPGTHASTVIAWAKSRKHGRPPFSGEFGGAGALSGHSESWFRVPTLAPGTYALVCLMPDAHGIPHAAHGMVAQFTVA